MKIAHKACSRGKDSVQAVAEAAKVAAAAIAAEKIVASQLEEELPEQDFHDVALLENTSAVLDLKGVCAIGTGMDEPIRSFELLLPTGRPVSTGSVLSRQFCRGDSDLEQRHLPLLDDVQ
eukprot:6209470-Pleurochrysis_carterae.AAC.1